LRFDIGSGGGGGGFGIYHVILTLPRHNIIAVTGPAGPFQNTQKRPRLLSPAMSLLRPSIRSAFLFGSGIGVVAGVYYTNTFGLRRSHVRPAVWKMREELDTHNTLGTGGRF